jgi:iron complex outermembrane receptor protein
MRRILLARAIAGAFGIAAGEASAQVMTQASSAGPDEPAVVVTGTPLGSGLFELVPPADALAGRRLLWQRKGSLGETLDGMPGVSATYFGPQASRPVIRGLDADRIRILQNGTGTLDVSAMSPDHALPYDPLGAERVEIVRGPAAVLYGGSAVGGVVNVIDGRIPEAPLAGVSGRIEPRYGGADRERSLGALLEAGNGRFALHADVFDRATSDLGIPGFARSARQRALDDPAMEQPHGRLPNSGARADGGTLGGSLTWAGGYAGLSYGSFRSNYGSVPEPDVRIDMRSERWDFAGEARDLAPLVSAVKFKLGRTDYEHRELEAGAVNTIFGNRGTDGRLELVHAKLGPLQGAVGLSFADFDVSALGAEAFIPRTRTRANGLFVYEELALGAWKLSAGARSERTRVASEGGGPADPGTGLPRFDPPRSRGFTASSGAFGLLYSFTADLALAANLSATQRAPAHYELFANGPHAATGNYEIGDGAFEKERSRSADLGLRWKRGAHSAAASVFRTRFSNFITLFGTGNTRGADGELNPPDADGDGVADASGEEILPEFTYRAVPAVFRGLEIHGRFRLRARAGTLDLLVRGDHVKATDRSTGQPLPRIAPTRLGIGLEYALERWTAALGVQHARRQNRVGANELPTDGYTRVNAILSYGWKLEHAALQAFVRLDNLLDEEARNHASFLKDIAPLGGRSILVGLRGSF